MRALLLWAVLALLIVGHSCANIAQTYVLPPADANVLGFVPITAVNGEPAVLRLVEYVGNGERMIALLREDNAVVMIDKKPGDDSVPVFFDRAFCPIGKRIPIQARPTGEFIPLPECPKGETL